MGVPSSIRWQTSQRRAFVVSLSSSQTSDVSNSTGCAYLNCGNSSCCGI